MKNYKKYSLQEKKEFWQRNPLVGDISVELEIDGLANFLMYCNNDDTVIKELYWTEFKGWELTSLTLWVNLLKSYKRKSGLILDIGSYSGIYSLVTSTISDDFMVYAFDIQSDCIKRLNKNINLNKKNNIEAIRAACTEENGEVSYYCYKEKDILSSIASIVPNTVNNIEQKVKSIQLDDFINNKLEFDNLELIKIDVEGAEKETLKGLNKTLKEFPDVLIEINNPKEIKNIKNYFPTGYNVYDINEDELVLKKISWFTKPSKYRNYLFSKKGKTELRNIFEGVIL